MKKVYFDNAATTKVDQGVFSSMRPYFGVKYGNASEPHSWGQEARAAIDQSRNKIATFFGCRTGEVIFTSCATESINLSHKGLIEALSGRKPLHIITSKIEHKAVLEACGHLEKNNLASVTYLDVNKDGVIDLGVLKKAIKPNTVLVSIMYVNNEVGSIQPIAKIGKLLAEMNKKRAETKLDRIFFHVDATQAIQYFDCHIGRLGVDMLSFTGHKIHAPKGVGGLIVKKDVPLVRQQDGGGQEYGLRAGTENVPYIVGLGEAVDVVSRSGKRVFDKISGLRDRLIKDVLRIPGVKLTGPSTDRAPHIASFVVDGAEGEAILLYLSEKGVAASSGSACTSGLLQPSHVLSAMGISPELAHGSLRFSLSKYSTAEDVRYVASVLPGIIESIRRMAPAP